MGGSLSGWERVAAVALLFALPGGLGVAIDLDRLEYENARDIGLHILKTYPPDQYYYVGVGRSPTPVTEILSNLSPHNVKTLPLSGMYARPQRHDGYDPPLDGATEGRLFDHFDRFLPTAAELHGRKLLFVDFVQGGGSAVATEEYLTKYLHDRRHAVELKMFVMAPETPLEKLENAGKHYDVFLTRPFRVLTQRFLFSWFDHAAPYGEFKPPFEGSEKLRPNTGERRAELQSRYRNYLHQDPMINRAEIKCGELLPWL
jgi:hypothetical protein